MSHADCTYSDDTHTWRVVDLWRAAVGLTPKEVALEEVLDDDLLEGKYWTHGGFAVMPDEDACEHVRRVEAADLAFPIILTPEGVVADGVHRIFKTLWMNRPTILAVRLPSMPEPVR